MAQSVPAATSAHPSARGVVIAAVLAALTAAVANSLIRIAALTAGAEPSVGGMNEGAVLSLTVGGAVVGAVGWWFFVRFSRSSRRVLSILVPVVFVLSLGPLLAGGLAAGTPATWTAMIGLAIMHLVTIVLAVLLYRRFIRPTTTPAVAQ